MRRKLILASGAAALTVASIAVWLARPEHPQPPIVVRYSGDYKGHPSFWVSNCTEYPVLVGFSAMDVPSGSAWSNCLRLVAAIELDFPDRLGQAPGVLAPHEEETGEITIRLPVASAGRWRATFVALRKETRLESAEAQVATALRHWGFLPRRLPDPVKYRLTVRTTSSGGSGLEVFKTFRQVVSADVAPVEPVEPTVVTPVGQAAPEALAKAREALRQKLRELDEPAATQPIATPLK